MDYEEEDEMYDDEDNEVDGAGISTTDEGIVGSGAEIKTSHVMLLKVFNGNG